MGVWKVINKVSMGNLKTIYRDTFVIIFAAIEASLVHMFLDIPDLTPLADTPLADLWGLRRCQERSDGYQSR